VDLSPVLVLGMWASGLALGAAIVVRWQIVGPGYTWTTAGAVALVGVFVIVSGGGTMGVIGTAAAVAAVALARSATATTAALLVAAVAFALVASTRSPVLPVITGSVLAGGVTSEMLLGHWFLVDPRLPRWSLKVLTGGAALGLVADAGIVAVQLAVNGYSADPFFGWAWLALVVMTALLITGVWLALDEPRYTGVMAATGLSYLAVLTSLGVLFLGRTITFG
jgi:hypothetical protein